MATAPHYNTNVNTVFHKKVLSLFTSFGNSFHCLQNAMRLLLNLQSVSFPLFENFSGRIITGSMAVIRIRFGSTVYLHSVQNGFNKLYY
jgi:hypothetical protein